ncbi:unnamed protein product [Heterobilharzia americana]|nr:unnamed protein product [Heterobilharzia americana]
MRDLNSRFSDGSTLVNDSKFRDHCSKGHFKWSFGRHKSKDINSFDTFISSRYVFSYEKESSVQQIEFSKPSELMDNNGLGGRKGTLDFGTAFSFSEDKSEDNDLSIVNNYKTIFTYSDPIMNDCHLVAINCFFPFLCWFYVKRLIKSERIIVFRLGKRMKAKGPGWVFMLPIYVKIKPVSGGTQDEAVVEVSCSSTFYLMEPDYAFSITSKSPMEIVSTQTQLCLLSALSHLEWRHLEHGNAKLDLANETKSSLNTRCGLYGIQVKEVEIGDLVLLRPPPLDKQKSNSELVIKHLQQLSCVLLNTREKSSHFDKMSGLHSEEQQQQESEFLVNATSSQQSEPLSPANNILMASDVATTMTINESSSLPVESENPLIMNKSQKHHTYKSINSFQHLWLSHHHPSLSRAITRAQGLLNSDIACQALERASLQLVISSQCRLVKDNLPSLDLAENQGYALLYLDASSGKVGVGCVLQNKQPNATLYIHIDDLIDVVEGRLDVLNAVESGKSFMTGSLPILTKMRHLLYLPSV